MERGQRALGRVPHDFSEKFFHYFARRTAPHGASHLHLFAEVNRLRRHGSHKLFVQHPFVCILGSCTGIDFPSLGAGHFPRPFFIRCFLRCLALLCVSICHLLLLVLLAERRMWCERHDRMEPSRLPRLVHAIASVHIVCFYDIILIYVVFFRETGHAELV